MSTSASPAVSRLCFSVFGRAANGFNENVRNTANRAFRPIQRRPRGRVEGSGYQVIYYYIKTISHLYRVYDRWPRISSHGFLRKRLFKIYFQPFEFEIGNYECTRIRARPVYENNRKPGVCSPNAYERP